MGGVEGLQTGVQEAFHELVMFVVRARIEGFVDGNPRYIFRIQGPGPKKQNAPQGIV
jgi:hypothetical protein